MDAKSKADFINSVAAGQKAPCPKCGAANDAGSKFCAYCGSAMSAAKPAFSPSEPKPEFPPSEPTQNVSAAEIEETSAIFAEGLPGWSIEPPMVVVRRR